MTVIHRIRMDYHDVSLGFSFSIPDGWHKMEHAIPMTFISDNGTIQISIGDALPNYIDPANREKFLHEPDCKTIPNKTLGGETNTIVIENNNNEGIISTVRNNLIYNITYRNTSNPLMKETIENLMISFQFPPLDKWVNAIQKTSNASQHENVYHNITQSTNQPLDTQLDPISCKNECANTNLKSKSILGRFLGKRNESIIQKCETCSRQMQVLDSTEAGGVTLSTEELRSGIGVAEQCWECGRLYCDKCYPSRPPNTCVCGCGRDAVRKIKNTRNRGSLRLVKVRYIKFKGL